ncbi:hypothetical protein GCM10009648_43980 [Tsukamurella spumae]
MSPKQQRALKLYIEVHGMRLMLQQPPYTYERIRLFDKAAGREAIVEMTDIVAEYETELKDRARERANSRRHVVKAVI